MTPDHQLVPKEPTEEMAMHAYMALHEWWNGGVTRKPWCDLLNETKTAFKKAVADAISAAPAPTQSGVGFVLTETWFRKWWLEAARLGMTPAEAWDSVKTYDQSRAIPEIISGAVKAKPVEYCGGHQINGTCYKVSCPQLRDGEPGKSGRACPIYEAEKAALEHSKRGEG